ncbi:MAG: circularly permuted type 2 ATP-grasp protein, partial [Gammaproteobacteria bacterium]|nr:circularly permuted type 2 ATP-grasp protein [Gammaproteobacteria bacterium]
MTIDWRAYQSTGFHDELVLPSGRARAGAGELVQALAKLSDEELLERKTAADLAIRSMGITFSVYHEGTNIDREWPFDIVPRLILKREWDEIARGLKQRVRALNAFIDDVYHHRRSLRDGVVPEHYVMKSREYRSRCAGIDPPHGVWSNVCGSDLVRDADGSLYVLEDNLRVPSGVSYMLENRAVMKRIFPELFEHYAIHPVDDYPSELAACLRSLSPRDVRTPRIV